MPTGQVSIPSICQKTLVLIVALLVTGCSSAAPTPVPAVAPTAAPAGGSCALQDVKDDESAIRGLLTAEGHLVVTQDIDALMNLWAEDAKVVDAKNTPKDNSDDQLWEGKDAIRHRYVRIVFPGAPKEVDHNDEKITINGDKAEVQSTTAIGSEVAKAGDRWEMVRQSGCWYLDSLTFNLEPAP